MPSTHSVRIETTVQQRSYLGTNTSSMSTNLRLLTRDDIYNLSITPTAAMYMHANKLCMRNSNTKQTESMHYSRHNFPQAHSHSDGSSHYCTPLYTIAIPKLLNEIKTQKLKLTGNIPWQEYAADNLLTLPSASAVIADFVNNIRQQIINYTSFGYLFHDFYDYELLIAPARGFWLDDLGRYPTGGRSHQAFYANTIIYRATFNEIEINFFKAILAGTLDKFLYSQHENSLKLPNDVIKTLRVLVCNQLATEIIVSKLIIFLNSCGQLKKVIAFSEQHLQTLLEKVVVMQHVELSKVIHDNIVFTVAKYQYDSYQTAHKYKQQRAIQLLDLLPPLSPQQKAAKRCKAIIEQYRLGMSKYLSEVNCSIDNLSTKICAPHQHHFLGALEQAKTLLTELNQARESFNQTNIKTNKIDEIKLAKYQFQSRCRRAINQALPVLERDLGWGDFLINLLKTILNGVIKLCTSEYSNSFFYYKRSEAVNEVEQIAKITCSG